MTGTPGNDAQGGIFKSDVSTAERGMKCASSPTGERQAPRQQLCLKARNRWTVEELWLPIECLAFIWMEYLNTHLDCLTNIPEGLGFMLFLSHAASPPSWPHFQSAILLGSRLASTTTLIAFHGPSQHPRAPICISARGRRLSHPWSLRASQEPLYLRPPYPP